MAVKDFNIERLAIDALAIGGPDGQASEPFLSSSVTYYGVFNQLSRGIIMEASGFVDDRSISLCIPRASMTVGFEPNTFIYRVFDSTTYQIITMNADEQWHDYALRRPLA